MDNVIKFPTKPAIFNQELRQKLEVGIGEFTDKPSETITKVEHIICTWLVAGARRFAESLGQKLGAKIVERAANE